MIIFSAYPESTNVYFLEDTGDKIKQYRTLSLSNNKLVITKTNTTYPRSMYEEDKHNTVDKMSTKLKRKFIKGILK